MRTVARRAAKLGVVAVAAAALFGAAGAVAPAHGIVSGTNVYYHN